MYDAARVHLKKKGSSIDFGGKRFRLNSDMSFHTKIYSLQLHVMGETGTLNFTL